MAERWQILGLELQPHQPPGATPLQLARALDGNEALYTFLRPVGQQWQQHGPAVTIANALKIAEHVAAGNPKALTMPNGMLSMAVGLLAIEALLRGEIAPDQGSVGGVGGGARDGGVGVPPNLAAPAAAHNPTAGAASCTRCGD